MLARLPAPALLGPLALDYAFRPSPSPAESRPSCPARFPSPRTDTLTGAAPNGRRAEPRRRVSWTVCDANARVRCRGCVVGKITIASQLGVKTSDSSQAAHADHRSDPAPPGVSSVGWDRRPLPRAAAQAMPPAARDTHSTHNLHLLAARTIFAVGSCREFWRARSSSRLVPSDSPVPAIGVAPFSSLVPRHPCRLCSTFLPSLPAPKSPAASPLIHPLFSAPTRARDASGLAPRSGGRQRQQRDMPVGCVRLRALYGVLLHSCRELVADREAGLHCEQGLVEPPHRSPGRFSEHGDLTPYLLR